MNYIYLCRPGAWTTSTSLLEFFSSLLERYEFLYLRQMLRSIQLLLNTLLHADFLKIAFAWPGPFIHFIYWADTFLLQASTLSLLPNPKSFELVFVCSSIQSLWALLGCSLVSSFINVTMSCHMSIINMREKTAFQACIPAQELTLAPAFTKQCGTLQVFSFPSTWLASAV